MFQAKLVKVLVLAVAFSCSRLRAPRSRRSSTVPASPTPRSRSDRPCPTAARLRPMARSAESKQPTSTRSTPRVGSMAGKSTSSAWTMRTVLPKTVEQTRKLIEQEDVLLIFGSLGTATNSAIHKYVNVKQVPHVLISAGAAKWADPQNYPWTMPWNVPFQTEAHIYAKYLLKERPNAKIAMLYQNDDFGRDYIKGLRDGLGEKAGTMIVAEASYEATDSTVDSQIVTLQASGADTFFNVASPKFGAQAIRKVYDLGWRPLYIMASTGSSIGTVLTPAGLDKSTGIISAGYFKADPTDPEWRDDAGTKGYLEFMKKYYPDGDLLDGANVFGYSAVQLLVYVLKQCGDNLTRENVMRQATSLKNVELPMLLPGMRVNTSPTDYRPLKQMQLVRFDGKRYVRIGELLGD